MRVMNTFRIEFMQKLLWDRIIEAISMDRINGCTHTFVKEHFNTMFPIEWQIRKKISNMQNIMFYRIIAKLKDLAEGKNV